MSKRARTDDCGSVEDACKDMSEHHRARDGANAVPHIQHKLTLERGDSDLSCYEVLPPVENGHDAHTPPRPASAWAVFDSSRNPIYILTPTGPLTTGANAISRTSATSSPAVTSGSGHGYHRGGASTSSAGSELGLGFQLSKMPSPALSRATSSQGSTPDMAGPMRSDIHATSTAGGLSRSYQVFKHAFKTFKEARLWAVEHGSCPICGEACPGIMDDNMVAHIETHEHIGNYIDREGAKQYGAWLKRLCI